MKSCLYLLILVTFWLFTAPRFSLAQAKLEHKVYLIGNASDLDSKSDFLEKLATEIEKDDKRASLLFLGDFSNGPDLSQDFLLSVKGFDLRDKTKVGFIPGNKEWDDYTENGYTRLRSLENQVEDLLSNSFYPSDGCPGPFEKELDDDTILIAINSGWFIHQESKPSGTASKCDLLFESEFWELLEDIIEDNSEKNVIIASHHPVHSNGQFAGRGRLAYENIPVIGSVFASYRRFDGSPDYLSNKHYFNYRFHLDRVLDKFQGLVFVSGHEHSIEIQDINGNIHINSGAASRKHIIKKSKETLYKQKSNGIVVLSYYDDGKVETTSLELTSSGLIEKNKQTVLVPACSEYGEYSTSINHFYSKCEQSNDVTILPSSNSSRSTENQSDTLRQVKTALGIPGLQYKAGGIRSWLMGRHFRNEWSTELELPLLQMESTFGGLKPFARGGGKQTNSLKLKNSKGEQWAFRSVNKNTGRDPYDPFRNTIATSYTQELISNQLPFGDVIVSKLLDNTDILHMRPRPYIMPDDPKLGQFRSDFANLMGTLEERPKGKNKRREGFRGADIVVSSHVMYRSLFEENKNVIDRAAFAKAILFDFWVGDWDRHGDNWKWAGYKEDGKYRFQPIPKDRDHVFAIYEGVIPKIARRMLPFATNFSPEIKSVKRLTYQGRHFVNFVASKMDRQDWLDAADYLQSIFAQEKLIDEAFNGMPPELRAFSKERIKWILVQRLAQLDIAAEQIYQRFTETGLIVGSNEKENFDITRNDNGSVTVLVKSGGGKRTIFNKTFDPDITKEIRIYGLAKDDEFNLSGRASKSVKIRIIGGSGEDIIKDASEVSGRGSHAKIYDKYGEDDVTLGPNSKIKAEYQDPVFDIYDYNYSKVLPLFFPTISSDQNFTVLGVFIINNSGFNKPDFKNKFSARVQLVPDLRTNIIEAKHSYRYLVGKADLVTRFRFARADLGFDDFYGLGNANVRNKDLDALNYYNIINDNYSIASGFEKEFFNKSFSETLFGIEHFFLKPSISSSDIDGGPSIFESVLYQDLIGMGKRTNLVLQNKTEVDFRNSETFPSKGAKFELDTTLRKSVGNSDVIYGGLEASIIGHRTMSLYNPLTVSMKFGGGFTFGDEIPFYHLSALGNSQNLRAIPSNLLLGRSSTYWQSQARYSLGSSQNKILPFNYGLLSFFDMGRVYSEGESISLDDWRYGYGFGSYLAFLSGTYSLHFTLGRNDYDESFFKLGLGLGLE